MSEARDTPARRLLTAGWTALPVVLAAALGGWWLGTVVGIGVFLIALTVIRLGLAGRPTPAPLPPEEWEPTSFAPVDRVAGALAWASGSGRHYDRMTRPVLQRALRAVLAGHGLDLDVAADHARIRELLGEPAWFLLDPTRPARTDSFSGAVDRATLTRVVARLEELKEAT